ncbi:MAG: tetratricopeptide repeat protein [Pseudomonadota bacterium]
MKLRLLTSLILVSILCQGCLVTMGKHKALEERVVALEQSNNELVNRTDRNEKRIDNVKTYVDDEDGKIRDLVANLRADVEDLRMQLARTAGAQEEVIHRLDGIQGKVMGIKGLMDERLGGDRESLPEDLPKDPDGMFKIGLEKYNAGYTKSARAIFNEFIRLFPDNEKADDAQFYVGETFFSESRFVEAVTEYRKVYDNYQRGDRFREAVLRIGLSYERTNDCDKAKKIYKFARDEFKKSSEGEKADEKYKALKKTCK